MKTFIFFLITLAANVHAQNLLDENNLWMNVNETISFGVYYEFFDIQGDTVIASKAYKKLYRKFDDPESKWEYIYGLREESSGKVYFVLRGREDERLLYDFNLQLNDSFFICNRVYIQVSLIDSVELLNGELRKRIHFDPGPETWIEGIGSMDGVVADGGIYYCNTIGQEFPFLNCFIADGEVLFHREGSFYPCLDGITSLQQQKPISINLYPNPFNNTATFVLPDTELSGELFIFTLMGELVNQQIITDQYTTIHRGTLPSGMYVYQFVSRSGLILSGKFSVN